MHKENPQVKNTAQNFEKAYSIRKLHKDLENPVCKCKGGYCYAKTKNGDIVRPCEL